MVAVWDSDDYGYNVAPIAFSPESLFLGTTFTEIQSVNLKMSLWLLGTISFILSSLTRIFNPLYKGNVFLLL